jgi:hypothetical protein
MKHWLVEMIDDMGADENYYVVAETKEEARQAMREYSPEQDGWEIHDIRGPWDLKPGTILEAR